MTQLGNVELDNSFITRLEKTCRDRQSYVCVGLDPDKSLVKGLAGHSGDPDDEICFEAMCVAAVAAAPYAAAFKPNAAFFEALETSSPLLAKLGRFLREKHPEIIDVCDAKRGDIGNTSGRYAEAVFANQKFDAITVNPLMGYDSVEPFLRDGTKGVFLLCLTSNPGAKDFLLQNDLYLRIAEKAAQWNTNNNVGLVVGATFPEYLERVRQVAPDLPLLIPGIGAQGGQLAETLDAIGAKTNRRFIISASRSVIYPAGATWANYGEKVSEAAHQLRDEINGHLM